jgi:hypothetical protein
MRQIWLLFVLLCGVAFSSGCGEAGPPQLTGTVTFDGAPIEEGRITFEPVDGQGTTAEAVVTQGKYATEVPAGKKRVRIVGMRVVGERPAYAGDPNSPMIKETKNFIPPIFNDQSNLEREVTASGTMDFELKSS